jgi:hypothetical protein
MEITASSNTIKITGNIKSVSDYQKIKSTVDSVIATHGTIILDIRDSISITSSIIGYLNKLVLKDKIALSMRVGNGQLLELLEDLNLIELLGVRKG